MLTNKAIVKIGGAPSSDTIVLHSLIREIGEIGREGLAVVHGGGHEVSALSQRLGIEPEFSDGVRITKDADMDIADMVLCGLVNTRLVRAFCSSGVPAVGLTGADASLLTGSRLDSVATRTATVSSVEPSIVRSIWSAGYVPVIASPGSDSDGEAVNINADEAAMAIGIALAVSSVIFLSDVPGVLGPEGTIESLSIGEAETLIRNGTIAGGMVAKIRSAGKAIEAGVDTIVVGSYQSAGDLTDLLGASAGTTIHG